MNSAEDNLQSAFNDEEKTILIFSAVARKDIEELKLLLNSPKWYTVEDEEGFNVLETAILHDNKEVFNFLLSIADFPLDTTNPEKKSPLMISLTECIYETDEFLSAYYAIELIKKGANVHVIDASNNTLLHLAVECADVEVCRLLIEKGVDVNAENNNNETPLEILYENVFKNDGDNFLEILYVFLYYNVDLFPPNNRSLGVEIFEDCLLMETDDHFAREMLFYYTIDEYSDYEADGNTLFYFLSEGENSALKYAIIDRANSVKATRLLDCAAEMFLINHTYLRAVLYKFDYFISDVISYCLRHQFKEFYFNQESLATFAFFLESAFADQIVKCINYLGIFEIMKGYYRYLNCNDNSVIAAVKKLIYYLLPYFDTISSDDLNVVYRKFGYCDLFKALLHMDIDVDESLYDVMPGAIFDVHFELEEYLDDSFVPSDESYRGFFEENGKDFRPGCSAHGVEKLMEYFAEQSIKNFCMEQNIEKLTAKAMLLPQVPLLQQLARESCRKFLVEKFNIETSRQFYTMLNRLPISTVHRKIISYETPLY